MGQVIFIVLVLGGLGFFFYRHTNRGTQQCTQKSDSDSGAENKDSRNLSQDSSNKADTDAQGSDIVTQILDKVCRIPGILQTELYSMFPDENRKNLQATLLQMDRDGKLRREREGSSYRLFIS